MYDNAYSAENVDDRVNEIVSIGFHFNIFIAWYFTSVHTHVCGIFGGESINKKNYKIIHFWFPLIVESKHQITKFIPIVRNIRNGNLMKYVSMCSRTSAHSCS